MSPTTNDEPAARAWDSTPRISAALYGLPMPLTMRASRESRTGIRADGIPEAPGDFLDALTHGPADAVGIRQRPRHC